MDNFIKNSLNLSCSVWALSDSGLPSLMHPTHITWSTTFLLHIFSLYLPSHSSHFLLCPNAMLASLVFFSGRQIWQNAVTCFLLKMHTQHTNTNWLKIMGTLLYQWQLQFIWTITCLCFYLQSMRNCIFSYVHVWILQGLLRLLICVSVMSPNIHPPQAQSLPLPVTMVTHRDPSVNHEGYLLVCFCLCLHLKTTCKV